MSGPSRNIAKRVLFGKRRTYLLLFVVITAIILLAIFASDWSSSKNISSVEFQGAKITERSEIAPIVKNIALGKSAESINLLSINDSLKKLPYVLTAYASFSRPENLKIEIVERKPLCIIANDKGKLSVVDAKAKTLPYRISACQDELPLIRNSRKNKNLNKTAIKDALQILENAKDAGVYRFVSELIFDSNAESYKILSNDFAYEILLGKKEKTPEKLYKFKKYIDARISDIETNAIKYIDLRWANKIIVKT